MSNHIQIRDAIKEATAALRAVAKATEAQAEHMEVISELQRESTELNRRSTAILEARRPAPQRPMSSEDMEQLQAYAARLREKKRDNDVQDGAELLLKQQNAERLLRQQMQISDDRLDIMRVKDREIISLQEGLEAQNRQVEKLKAANAANEHRIKDALVLLKIATATGLGRSIMRERVEEVAKALKDAKLT